MSFDYYLQQLQSSYWPLVSLLERDPVARWSAIAIFWVLIVFRAFGRGHGTKRGLFNWFDWLVVIGGAIFVLSLQYSGRLR